MAAICPSSPPVKTSPPLKNYFDPEVLFDELQSCYNRYSKVTRSSSIVLNMVRRRVDLIFDSFYPLLTQKDARVCINIHGVERQFGNGDITFANKAAKGLYDELGCRVTILSPFPTKHESLAAEIPVTIEPRKDRIFDTVANSHVTFAGPVRDSWKPIEKLFGEGSEFGEGAEIIINDKDEGEERVLTIKKLSEYSVYHGGEELPLGPDIDEGGMYFDEKPMRRLPLAQAVAELSDRRLRVLLQSLITTADSRVYFGYGHDKQLCHNFIEIVSRYEGEQEGRTVP